MDRSIGILAIVCCAVPLCVQAADEPATGKFLVATEMLRGPAFAESVILLLHHDSTGAVGLVVNRPTETGLARALPDFDGLERYDGKLYWGGPVEVYTLRALLRSKSPPEGAVRIVDGVHIVPLDESLLDGSPDATVLRFFMGYAGWAPGQLEQELRDGSWHVVPATEELVFAAQPERIWRRLAPPVVHRASVVWRGLTEAAP